MKLPLTFVMSQTFSVWTEEDIEAGETNNNGFDFEKKDFTLEELKDFIEKNEFRDASEYPVSSAHVWLNNVGEPNEASSVSLRNGLHCNYIKDADGLPIDTALEGKLWRNLVREVVGEKIHDPEDEYTP